MSLFLVTGGAGFIGSNTVEELIRRGHAVRVLDDLSSGNIRNLDGVKEAIDFIKGDITDEAVVKKACHGADNVLHLAGSVGVPISVKDPVGTTRINVMGTLNVLAAARDAGVKRVVFAASAAAYGDQPGDAMHEDMQPRPLSPYAAAKVASEQHMRLFHDLYGLETVNLRYFNVFGPRQDPSSPYAAAIPLFASRMLQGKQPIVFGDGEQTRDFCFVANNVSANILASTVKEAAGQTFNIATGTSISVNELIRMINASLGTSILPSYEPARPGEIKHSKANIDKARKVMGYVPLVDVSTGIALTLAWANKTSVP